MRLRQGKRGDVTDFGDPRDVARRWRDQGATWLHVVDLDAAFDGKSQVEDLLRDLVKIFGGHVEIGGGLRTMEDIDRRMDAGFAACILGSVAVSHPEIVEEACRRYPGKIVAGIDARDGRVAVKGWVEKTDVDAVEFGKKMRAIGVRRAVYTDVSKDGMMQGPNIAATRQMVQETGLEIVGSGGVSSMEDLQALTEIGCGGAILGRAMYDGFVDLREAICRFRDAT